MRRQRKWTGRLEAFGHTSGPLVFSRPDARCEPNLREPWALKTTDTLRPGARGTKRLVAGFGERLVCVRYRTDPQNRKRYKTVELIVAEAEWAPPPGPDDPVHVRVAFAEEDLRARVKASGDRWRPESKTWELPLWLVRELGIETRSSKWPVPRYRNP